MYADCQAECRPNRVWNTESVGGVEVEMLGENVASDVTVQYVAGDVEEFETDLCLWNKGRTDAGPPAGLLWRPTAR